MKTINYFRTLIALLKICRWYNDNKTAFEEELYVIKELTKPTHVEDKVAIYYNWEI